jgi:prepilin-type N-terminal cleavage/methylation domain-containing protein
MISNAERRSGFTLAEVLAAMMFLAILVPVVVQGLSLASRAGAAASRETVALQLAENRLTELIAEGSWTGSAGEGDFGEDWAGYAWSMEQTPAVIDDLVELTMHVDYRVQGRVHRVSLSTWAVDEEATE